MSNPAPHKPAPKPPEPTTPVAVTLNLTAAQAAALQSLQAAGVNIGPMLTSAISQRVNIKRQQVAVHLRRMTEDQLDTLLATLPALPLGTY